MRNNIKALYVRRAAPIILFAFVLSCSSKKENHGITEFDPYPVKYQNELFSICLPEGWMYDDSRWMGLDSMQNEVDFYNPDDKTVWLHFVKAYYPMPFKNIDEAVDFAKSARSLSKDDFSLINEVDNIIIDGIPTKILIYANYVGNDTIIQKQYVTYIRESHIVMYFNEDFFYENRDKGQTFGDELMENVVINKEIENPLEKKGLNYNSLIKDYTCFYFFSLFFINSKKKE